MKLKISIKILLAFLFIISLMSFLSFYLINSSYRSLQQSIGEFSKLLAEEMMERIDHDLYIKIEELRFYLNNLIQSDPVLNYFNEMKTKKVLSAHVDTNILMDKLIQNDLSKLLKKNLIDSY